MYLQGKTQPRLSRPRRGVAGRRQEGPQKTASHPAPLYIFVGIWGGAGDTWVNMEPRAAWLRKKAVWKGSRPELSHGWVQLISARRLAVRSAEPPEREERSSHQGCPRDTGVVLLTWTPPPCGGGLCWQSLGRVLQLAHHPSDGPRREPESHVCGFLARLNQSVTKACGSSSSTSQRLPPPSIPEALYVLLCFSSSLQAGSL